MDLITLGRTIGFSFAAGVNLYATVAILGLASRYAWVDLPPEYQTFNNPWVIGIALVLYALLPILRNTLTGILGVDPAVRESAVAMGMTGRQLLWEVELPLATRTILAGLRIATVTTMVTAARGARLNVRRA